MEYSKEADITSRGKSVMLEGQLVLKFVKIYLLHFILYRFLVESVINSCRLDSALGSVVDGLWFILELQAVPDVIVSESDLYFLKNVNKIKSF